MLLLMCVLPFLSAITDEVSTYSDIRIVNGTDAQDAEFPFAVSLRYNNVHFCGGSILNENFVLTAAHCVCARNLYIQYLSVQYGVLKIISTNASSIAVSKIICHENYDPNIAFLINDVALLQLEKALPQNTYKAVTVAGSQYSTKSDLDGTVIGWGHNYTNGSVQEHLQKVDVVVYNDTICKKGFVGYLNLEHHLCAGWPENGRGTCQGDSGGPLVVNNVQVGVVSFGAGGDCGLSNATYPKVLSRLSSYIEWIKELAGDVKTSNSANHIRLNKIILITIYFIYLFLRQ